ncbi:non-ribosomal peptide synthetase [Nitratidesulfovibrio sp. HK-II]|uniref:amino acid adenylation domain-containing protein n=1 Tax=Nitratidesulfovibrio sp. HK-II TaxID=2009266 RepID=UPI003A6B1D18
MKDAMMDDGLQEIVPLTGCQKELWLACRTSLSEYAEVSIRGSFPIANAVCPDRLREAIRIVLRHTPLPGATLCADGDEPCFIVGAATDVPDRGDDIDFRFLDLRDAANPEQAAKQYAAAFFEEHVDNPLMRYALLRTGESESLYLVKSSHLVLDGLAFFYHTAFVADVYTELAQGRTPGPYERCSCLEEYRADAGHAASSRFAKDMAFWEEHLERLPEKRIFRALPGRPDVLGNTRYKKYLLAQDASRQAGELQARYGVSPAGLFTALHALVLSYMCDEKDIVVQTPLAFGERKAFRKRQGAHICMPPTLLDMRQHETFASLLADVGAQSAAFFRRARTPFQLAVRNLGHKNLAYIADTFINYLPNAPEGSPDFHIREAVQHHSVHEPVLFGALVMEECHTRRLSLTVRSCRNHFSERDVDRYVRRVEYLVRQLASGADLPQLDYLLEEEAGELRAWQRGDERHYPVRSMPGLFDEKAEAFAGRDAVRDEHGAVLSYAELRENSLRCAAWLAGQGVGRGDVVAVLARRALLLPEIILGIQRCGAVYLPVDPKSPADRIAYIVADAGAVLTLDVNDAAYAGAPPVAPPLGPDPGDGAYLIYTSGSTGRPKGVLAPHGGFVNMIQGQIEVFGVGPEDRVLQFAPPVFDASLSEMFMALHAGACLYPVSDAYRNAPWDLKGYMADNGVTVTTFPPSYLRLFDGEPFPGLGVLITAGEPPVAADALHYAGALRYFNAYGPTETCVCASMKRVAPDEALPISSGRPIPNGVVCILDSSGRPRPAGMVGELWVGGASVALGYHGNPELTGQRFRPLPGSTPDKDGSRAYATGDLALWSETGEILLVGRADDQVKVRGNRVELGEVAFLLERCEGVRQAQVLAVKDGNGQTELAAFMMLRPDATQEAVARWSRANLPPYMVPTLWHVLDAMPVTRTGKVDRTALRRMAEAPVQAPRRERPVDERLLDACQRTMGGTYDPEANFFDQGGNSLKGMLLLQEIRKVFGVDLAFRDFVACETLFDVEAMLRQRGEQAAPPPSATVPLSRAQYRIWAYQQANQGTVDYNMPLLLEVGGENARAFTDALRRALGDQELLCCTIGGDIDAPHLARGGEGAIPVREEAFADEAAATAFLDGQIHAPFDLRREPPVRMAVARLGDRLRVLVVVHHIAGDGETLDIVLRNALEYLRGGQPEKGALAVQARFCHREAEYLRSDACRDDAAYWRAMLTPPVPPVSTSAARIGAMTDMALPPALAEGLDRLARRSGTTELTCFVPLLARFLCRACDRPEMLVAVPVGLRETQEEFRTAGFFVNTVPLRFAPSPAANMAEDARATARQLREAVAHGRYCDIPAMPDFLATHIHAEPCQGPGLALRRLPLQLRASKLAGSFTLVTGEDSRIILEHDAGFIHDGAALLAALLRDMASALGDGGMADAGGATIFSLAARSCDVEPHAGLPDAMVTTVAGGSAPSGPREALAQAWAAILHAEAVDAADFFRAGGDSIKAIQITGLLHRSGVTVLSAPDFLRTPKFADLCALLDRADCGQPDAGDAAAASASGVIAHPPLEAGQMAPLLPIQQALLRDHPDHWTAFHMLLPLELDPSIAPETVQAWLETLPGRFEALRLAFSPRGAEALAEPRPVTLRRCDMPHGTSRVDALRHLVREVTAGLDPQTGHTLGAGLADCDGARLLALVGHHLVLDAVSLDILLRDLRAFVSGASVSRMVEGCGLAARSAAMERLVAEGTFPSAEDREFWAGVCRTPAAPLNALRTHGIANGADDVPGAGGQDIASERVTARAGLRGFRAGHTRSVPADLLAALAVALHWQGQHSTVFVTLESHGRDSVAPGCDLSRSLGWFTAVCPLPLTPAASGAQARRHLLPWLRDAFTPRGCNAYGYLRRADPQRFGYAAQIGFNYLGAVGDAGEGGIVPLPSLAAPGEIPGLLHPRYRPDAPLDLSASFDASGELHLLAWFSPHLLAPEWVAGLLECWAAALRTLPAYSPPVDDETRAAILADCRCTEADVERIERPDPSHEPMLYQHLAPGDGVYTQQVEFHFGGELDEFRLMAAWDRVVDRHESLRSLFPMPHHGEFFRVALRRARTGAEYHCLSHLPPDAAGAEAKALVRQRRGRAFDLARGPLLHAQFFRLDARTLVMSWCFHHLLMDGWCIGVLLRELFATCRSLSGRPTPPLPAPFALAEYERWQADFDMEAAREYWAALLDGYGPLAGVAPASSGPSVVSSPDGEPETLELALDVPLGDALRQAAASHAVTLSALTQALWAVVLGVRNGHRRDVVFGVVTSGRPAEVDGMDRAVGLFIRTLPLRARWNEADGFASLLADLREQGLGQMRHGYLPLAAMGRNLLDHLMVFENYPADAPFGGADVQLLDVRGYEKIPYPLGITVIPGAELRFRFLYDPAVLARSDVENLRDRLHAALRAVGGDRDVSCRTLEAVVAAVPASDVASSDGASSGVAVPADAGLADAERASSAPAPQGLTRGMAAAPSRPHTDEGLEETVRSVYAEVLGRGVVTPDEDFFALGGHSLSAMQVMALLGRRLGVKVGIDDILSHSSPRQLAARIRDLSHGEAPSIGPNEARAAARIPRVDTEGVHPLSPAQQRIWFLQRLHEDGRIYQIPFAARLPGDVDADALQQALLLLEGRHDALRLRVSAHAPEQRLAPLGGLKLELRDGPCTEQDLELAPMDFGFDAPLARVTLFREGASGCVMLLSVHHIVFDGWSAEILLRELNEAYAAVLRGDRPAWPPQETDYLSHVAWEREREPAGLAALKDALLPLPERLRLPLDFPRPAVQGLAGGVEVFRLDTARGRALKARARDAGTTLFPVLLALVGTFLHRHTGQDDLIVGCPAANRELGHTQGMIGLFVNTLAIRMPLRPDGSFDELVGAVDAAFRRALAAQSYPFEKLVDALGVERDTSRNPLFDVFVALEDATWHDYGQEPLRMRSLPLPHRHSKFDLSFYFREMEPDAYEVHLEFRTDLFTPATARNLCERLSTLLDAVLRGDGASGGSFVGVPLHALDLMPERELRQLQRFNDTAEVFDIERDADSLFREQLARTPGHAAIIAPNGQVCNYAEFDARIAATAAWLAGQGVSPGDHACVCLERSLDMMVSIFAVLRLGAVYVPVAPGLPAARLRAMLEDLGAPVVICDPRFASAFDGCGGRVLVPDTLAPDAYTPVPRGLPPAGPAGRGGVAPDSVAYVIFTSGSTGRPKGVQVEHRSLCNRLLWMQSRFPIGPDDVVLQKTTVSFDVSVWELFWWSWCGAGLALLEPEGEKDPARIVEAIHARKVTVLHFVPSMLRAFLDYLEAFPGETSRISTLRYVFTSGEALPRDLVARFNALLRAQLHNLYGPTEATIDVSWYPCAQTPPHGVPIGRPVSNTGLHVLDARMRPVPPGVAGEIWISGVQVARGYANRPDLTERAFVADPSFSGGRMYRTGDLGRWLPDGNMEYLGRNDDQVKIRGHRIELGEVEAALARCPGVAQAVARTCRIGGYDALEAFLLPRAGAELTFRDIRSALAASLPEYMCPSRFHVVDDIPLTPSGKADRGRLAGAPLLPAARAVGNASEVPLLDEVRALWRQTMPEVDVRDPDIGFFGAGGNSLLLVRLHGLLDQRWPGVFTLAGLFSESTIRAQAAYIAQTRSAVRPRSAKAAPDAPVAIIGMAVRLGDHADTERFWQDLASGADLNVPLPEARRREVRQVFEAVGFPFDEARLREAAYLSDVSSFDHKRFGLAPGDAALLDPRQRVFLETAMQALDDAGYGGSALEGRNVGAFVGASPYRLFQDAVSRSFPDQAEQIYLLNVPSNVVARLSYLKDWNGPAATVDTACSSVLKAVHDACHSLRAGESCVALAGGVHLIDLPVKADRTFTIEAASGRTRTFDAEADGVGAGEGAAVFVLKLLDDALRDHDAIHAVIAGSAVNQDGRSSSMAAPNPGAQAEVITLAARNASVELEDISLFEAHGTATVLGDPVEIEGLTRAFAREGAHPRGKIPIGSVKGNLGHLDAAAGAVGLAKAVLCLKKGLVPPQPHFTRPNPHIDFDAAPVRVAQTLEPLPEAHRPWRCGVSSFGLSGVNTHVILSEPWPNKPRLAEHDGTGHERGAVPRDGDGAWCCAPLSAQSEADLLAYRRAVRDAVARNPHWPLHAIAATLAAGRDHLDVRAVVVARTRQELLDALDGGITPVTCHARQAVGAAAAAAGAAPTVHATREAADEAARAFLAGQRLAWPADRPLHRVHLPATPFTRVPLWPRFASAFLSGPVQTPTGSAFALSLDRPDFWPVAEHCLNGVPTLVGMGMLDIIAKAVERGKAIDRGQSVDRLPLCIESLRWRSPVTMADGSRATLVVERRDHGHSVELHHLRDGAWSVAASATVGDAEPVRPAAPPAALDMAALRAGLRPFEARGAQTLVSISGRWLCREALWISDGGDRLLAQLALPDAYRHDLHTFRWHPAMVDVAASLALHGVSGFVPARCGAVRLYRPLPARAFAHVGITERQPGMITARCTVADLSGNVVLEMDDLVFLALAQARPERDEPDARPEPELYSVEWTRADLPPVAAASPTDDGGLMLLGGGDGELCEALATRACLRRELPARPEERQALAGEILDRGIDHIVYLPAADDDHWAFCSQLQELCRARLRAPLRVTVVGGGGLPQSGGAPEHALLLGPLLCLHQEEPRISCAHVDLTSAAPEPVRAFMDSLGRIDGPYRIDGDGNVRVRRLNALGATGPTGETGTSGAQGAAFPALAPDGCVVISGGLGGMGLTLARQLHAATGVRVALLHRRGEVPADMPFAAYRCDVTDSGQVAAAFAAIRREVGPVQGVIHAAGVAGDGYLLSKGREAYEAVLAPKVAGTWNLHRETLGDDLRFFVLASSRTSLTGAPGQCDYTAANAFLNAFARYRKGLGLPALAICWNTWADVGMAARHGADRGAFTLAPEQALGVLTGALASGSDLVVVAMPGEGAADHPLATLVGVAPASGPAAEPQPASGAPDMAAAPDGEQEAQLLEIFRDCLGYDAELTREDDFFDLGGDSIAATRIVSRMDQALGIKASVVDLLESDSLGDFVDKVLAERRRAAPAARGLQPAPAREAYPVGREQLAILYADMLSEGHLGFNLPAFLKLPRDLDRRRLEAAIGALVQRHEVLRTSFRDFEAEHPNMVIHPYTGFTLEETRLPDLAHKDALITPFDLKKEGGFRVRLLTLDDGEHVLFYDVHHALADGRTISLLNAELYRLYHGLPLEPVSAQQKDFAWRQFTQSNAQDKAYWLALYRDGLPKLDLPAAYPRPPVQTNRGGMYEFELPGELVAGIRDLARREGATNYHVVLTAWSLLVHARTGDDDFVIAISVDSRDEHLNTAGMLASLLPLRLRVDGAKPLGALLRDTRTASNEALRHRGYILGNLLADLKPPVCLDRSPLSEVILSYMNFEFAAEGVQMFEPMRFSKHASKTDLSIFASDTGSAIGFALEYYADLFSHDDVVRMGKDLTRILELMTTGPADEPVRFTHAPPARPVPGPAPGPASDLAPCALASVVRELGGELREGIRGLAARMGASAASVMLATFAVLLGRVTARQEFVVDVASCGPVRFLLDEETEFGDLLAHTHAQLLGNGQEARVAPDDGEPGRASGSSFPRVAFLWDGDEAGASLAPGHGGNPGEHDLVCRVRDDGGTITVRLDHDAQSLAAETAGNWLEYYVLFLDGAAKGN